MLVFSTGFVNYCPSNLLSGLLSRPPSPLPCVNKYSVYTYAVCMVGVWVHRREGLPQTDETPAAKSLYRTVSLDSDIWHCILPV